jgi:hypothetical protein
MNGKRFLTGREDPTPQRTLHHLERVGPTTNEGTTDRGLRRQAAALGLRAEWLGNDLFVAHEVTRNGHPIAVAINPGALPMWLQLQQGGPWQDDPGGHEVLFTHVGPRGGALVEDPEGGRYPLTPRQVRDAIAGNGGSMFALGLE